MNYPSDTDASDPVWRSATPSAVRAAQWLWFVYIALIVVSQVLVVVGAEILARDLAIEEMPEAQAVPALEPKPEPTPVEAPVLDAAAVEQYLADHIPHALVAMSELLLLWWLACRLGDGRRYARVLLDLYTVICLGIAFYYLAAGYYDEAHDWDLIYVQFEAVYVAQLCCAVVAVALSYTASARPHFVDRFRV